MQPFFSRYSICYFSWLYLELNLIDDYCWLMEFLQTSWRLSNDSHESLEIVVDSFVVKVCKRFFRDIQFVIFHGLIWSWIWLMIIVDKENTYKRVGGWVMIVTKAWKSLLTALLLRFATVFFEIFNLLFFMALFGVEFDWWLLLIKKILISELEAE